VFLIERQGAARFSWRERSRRRQSRGFCLSSRVFSLRHQRFLPLDQIANLNHFSVCEDFRRELGGLSILGKRRENIMSRKKNYLAAFSHLIIAGAPGINYLAIFF